MSFVFFQKIGCYKEIEGFFDKKELSVYGLVRVITDETRMWRQAGAQISLVDQYGGTPFDPG
jgi:hypothetical protein